MYIHCLEGWGRTGVVVSLLHVLLRGLEPLPAMQLASAGYRQRREHRGTDVPKTHEQRMFVHTVAKSPAFAALRQRAQSPS